MSEPERGNRPPAESPAGRSGASTGWSRWLVRSLLWLVGLAAAGTITVMVLVGIEAAIVTAAGAAIAALVAFL